MRSDGLSAKERATMFVLLAEARELRRYPVELVQQEHHMTVSVINLLEEFIKLKRVQSFASQQVPK